MCAGREHRYRIEMTLQLQGGVMKDQSLVLYAKGAADAIAKADGWAHKEFPNADFLTFKVSHSSYGSDASAIEHGAILPTR